LLLESPLASDACYDANISSEICGKVVASIGAKNVPAQNRADRMGPPRLVVGARDA
jgi:hypothetical protein